MKNASQPHVVLEDSAGGGHAVWLHRRSTDAPARPDQRPTSQQPNVGDGLEGIAERAFGATKPPHSGPPFGAGPIPATAGSAVGSPWSEDNVLAHPLPDASKQAAASAFAEACEALRRRQTGEPQVEQITLDDTTLPRPAQETDYTPYWLLGDDGSLCIGSGDEMIRLDPAQTRRLLIMLTNGIDG